MFSFTLEEVQFIKDHLNYPQDNEKALMYYDLVKKLRSITKTIKGRPVGEIIIDDPLARLPADCCEGSTEAVFFVKDELLTVQQSIERAQKRREEFKQVFSEQNQRVTKIVNDLAQDILRKSNEVD